MAIGRQLVEKGYAVAVNDLRRESAAGLLGLGASWAETPRTLAQSSDVVITSLPGPAEVEQVLFDAERGALKGLGAGKAYIDMTTNTPSAFRKIAQACRCWAERAKKRNHQKHVSKNRRSADVLLGVRHANAATKTYQLGSSMPTGLEDR